MDRRRFLAIAAGGVALGALAVLQGCSGGSDNGDMPPTTTPETPTYADKNAVVSTTLAHSHSLTLTAAQQQAGVGVKINTTGGDHTHQVTLKAEDVVAIAAGAKRSDVTSTDAGHFHTFTFNP
jgi:hypothetical protein